MRSRLFIDMDGTLAVFNKGWDHLIYNKGYFENLLLNTNVVDAVKILIAGYKDIEVFVLSAYLSDSPFALEEKNRWLDRNLPEVDAEHRLFIEDIRTKAEAVPGSIGRSDVLLDDYTKNLLNWPGTGIKLLNGINHTRGTWKYDAVSWDEPAEELSRKIAEVCRRERSQG